MTHTRENAFATGSVFQGLYEILSELGAGTFGRIYKARQLSTGQEVAIKTLHVRGGAGANTSDQSDVDRFRRELKLCAALSHPHIVRLIDSGEYGAGLLYVVFEHVPGTTLRELLTSEGALEMGEAVHLMAQVLDALGCAHAQGVVHRDLKPENMMVTRTGIRRNALVLDFGMGGFVSEQQHPELTRITATGELLGTPSYAAPEQLRGEPPSLRSDIYSWGLVFLECLTGEAAFSGDSVHDVLLKQLSPDPVPMPGWLRRHRLRRVLEAATVKDVAKRDVTLAGLLEFLETIARDVPPGRRAAEPSPPGQTKGERRQLTIVACRVVVTRADRQPVDLDELDRALRAKQDVVTKIGSSFGGTIASPMTDRLLLAFGYPKGHENDGRRGVRAALEIVRESGSRPSDTILDSQVHVGIHSGLLIVRGHGARVGDTDLELVGTAPGIALRLAECAAAGEVLISLPTLQLLREEVDTEPVADSESPEESGRLPVFRVQGLRRPIDQGTLRAETPFVGRREELAQLHALWRQAESGEPRCVLLTGEPGIGKSRLIRELRRGVPSDTWLECRCVAEGQSSPLQPIIEVLKGTYGPIDQLLARHGFDLTQTVPLFASLLGTPLDDRYAPLRLSPERQRELTLQAIVSLVLRIARRGPLAYVVEDLHWADPTTLELLALLVEELHAAEVAEPGEAPRLCVVLSARPEFSSPWGTADMPVLALPRLGRGDVETLVGAGFPGETPPPGLVECVSARTDGIPLFVEEMTRAVVESPALLAQAAAWTSKGGWDLEIPGSLRELLAARLDGLSESARETVQLAAALGREFGYDLLQAVTPRHESLLRGDVRELLDARLLHQRRSREDGALVFKHSLVRDAAYGSMLRGTREAVHRRIATILGERFPQLAERQPELLALHLEAGGQTADAIRYWHRAGDRLLRRAAYAEATGHLRRGLAALERVPASAERDRNEIELLTTLGTVLFSTKGYADPDVEGTFGRARALCEKAGEDVSLKILAGIMGVYITRNDCGATETLLPQFHRLAERRGDAPAQVTAYATLGQDAFWRGEHVRARDYLDRARGAYLTDEFGRFARDYGYDGGVFSCTYRMWNLWALGYPLQAAAAYRELMDIAARSFDPYTLPLALGFGIVLAHACRDGDATLARSEELVVLATEQKLFFWLALGLCGRGGARALQGRAGDGIEDIQQGLSLLRMIGVIISYGYHLTFLAAAHLEMGQIAAGLAAVTEGLDLCAHGLGRFHEPELLRLQGELLRREGRLAEAEAPLRHAVSLAEERGAKGWAIRAATSLGGLLAAQGNRTEAARVVTAAYDTMPEGSDLPDVEDAKTLLGALT